MREELLIRIPLRGQSMREASSIVREFAQLLDRFPSKDCTEAMGDAVCHSSHPGNPDAVMFVDCG